MAAGPRAIRGSSRMANTASRHRARYITKAYTTSQKSVRNSEGMGIGSRGRGSPSSLLCDVSQVVIVGQEGSGVGIRGEIMWQTSSLADNVDDFSTGALLFHTTAQVRDVL